MPEGMEIKEYHEIEESIDYDENGEIFSCVLVKNTWADIIQYKMDKELNK